jgi:hypothetical protein
MSALPPESGQGRVLTECPLCAKSGLMHRSKRHGYSITAFRASGAGGTVRPSARAVLRLITISNLVGAGIVGAATRAVSLDHLVSKLQKGFTYWQTESFGRFEIDNELELVG